MTDFGMYVEQTGLMLNIEFARIIQADREREIQAELRIRRLLRTTDHAEPRPDPSDQRRRLQRPASTGAATR